MEENNKQIIKNSAYLYIRTIVTIMLGFVVTRIVLEKLGTSDYGIYNVVGGFVSMFTVLNSILQGGTRRFLALRIGEGKQTYLKLTFSTALVIHIGIALVVLAILESIGLWLLNYELNISPERLNAANWIYQLSIISVIVAITQTPYTAIITAHEHFNIYAYISLFDIIGKLLLLLLLSYIPGDKLIIYGIIQLAISFLSMCIYRTYCIKHFSECSFSLRIDKACLKEMISFSGWSTIGHISVVINGQGLSILLNLFFNTVMNAARGLATTITFAIDQLISNFIVAATPQLVKLYGAGEKEKFHQLIFNVSQYTLFLLAIFIVPVLLEIKFVLALWLHQVPDYTASFIKISLIISFLSYSNRFVDQGVVAIGRVKELNLYVTPIYLIVFPLAYLFLKCDFGPICVYWVMTIPMFIAMLLNLSIIHRFYDFPMYKYLKNVFLKNIFLVGISAVIPWIIHQQMDYGIVRFFTVCILSVCCTLVVLYNWGLGTEAKTLIKRQIRNRFHLNQFN